MWNSLDLTFTANKNVNIKYKLFAILVFSYHINREESCINWNDSLENIAASKII